MPHSSGNQVPAVLGSTTSKLSNALTVAVSGLGARATPAVPVNMGDPETFSGLMGVTTACLAGAAGGTPAFIADSEATGTGCFAGGCGDYTVGSG